MAMCRGFTRTVSICFLLGFAGMVQSASWTAFDDARGNLTITALNTYAIEVHFRQTQLPANDLPSFALKPPSQSELQDTLWQVETAEDSTKQIARWGDIRVVWDEQAQHLSFFYNDELKFTQYGLIQAASEGIEATFVIQPDEKLLAGGQRILGMDRRGYRLPLDNQAHYGYTTESTQMYYSLPAYISSHDYALLLDNTAKGWLDLDSNQNNQVRWSATGGRTSYILVFGADLASVSKHVVQTTGLPPMPARWTLGSFASRFGYRSQQQALNTASLYRAKEIPLDALVLDLYWFGADIKGHMGNLQWDPGSFPYPQQLTLDLDRLDVNLVNITEPFILTSSGQWSSAVQQDILMKDGRGQPYQFDFYFGRTGLVDIFDPAAQEWFWSYYDDLLSDGVDGWWGDLGEPEVHPDDGWHLVDQQPYQAKYVTNAYGHVWAKMVYERSRIAKQKRPLVLMRSGFLGTQRHGIVPWTGDVDRSWGGLSGQVELKLQMGLFGLGYTHSDLGGFAGGETFDPELYLRWLQFGVFQPIFRPHAQDHIASEPVFHQPNVIGEAQRLINFRYRLLPYIYSMSYQHSIDGSPLMRPLAWDFGDEWLDNSRSYLFGDNLLVTPIIQPGINRIELDIPNGLWYDLWTQDRWSITDNKLSYQVHRQNLPVLVKAGSFLPLIPTIQSTADYGTEVLQVHYFRYCLSEPGCKYQQSQVVYDDDGYSLDPIESEQFQLITLKAEENEYQLRLDIGVQGEFSGAPQQRQVQYVVHGLSSAPNVKIDGRAIEVTLSDKIQQQNLLVAGQLSVPRSFSQWWHGKPVAEYDAAHGRLYFWLELEAGVPRRIELR